MSASPLLARASLLLLFTITLPIIIPKKTISYYLIKARRVLQKRQSRSMVGSGLGRGGRMGGYMELNRRSAHL